MEAKLGDRVKDKVSGFQGIATGKYSYLSGCDRLEVQPSAFTTPEGEMKLPDSKVFDVTNLVVNEVGVVKLFHADSESDPMQRPGGPKDHQPSRR